MSTQAVASLRSRERQSARRKSQARTNNMHQVQRATEGPNWNSFSPITPYDHAGYIWIAALFGMSMSLLVAVTRIWIKKDAFGLDDTLFVAATVG